MKRVLMLAVAASALASCAAGAGNDGPIVEKEYRTGSNLAVKRSPAADGVSSMSKDDVDRTRDSSLSAGAQLPPPRPGSR
ncbi:MAG TPA: hypothetical protein VII36_09230 [Usitatibacter sp.]